MDPLSAIASTIAVVQAISSVYTTIRTIKNLPGEFSEVARNLPLVTSTLDAARVRIELDGLDSAATAAIEIENKTRGGRDSSSLMLYRSTVLRLGKASRVEALMQSILKSLQGLAMKQIFLASGQIQVAALQDAVHRLADVPSSVPDSVFNGSESVDQHILQGGTGNQFINKGQTKNVNFGASFETGGGPVYYDARGQSSEACTKILQTLYTLPYEDRKNRNPERAPGTCEWFVGHSRFQEWNKSQSSSILWVSADPGSGKSVLARHLVDSVLKSQSRTTCYFFFKDDFEDQRSVRNALCCLLHQLFTKGSLLSDTIVQQLDAHRPRLTDSFGELWKALLAAAEDSDAGEIVCVLDAFDECQSEDQSTLSEALFKFYRSANSRSNLKFLITSRPYNQIRLLFKPLENEGLSMIHLSGEDEAEVKKIAHEIDIYIKFRVEDIAKLYGHQPDEKLFLLERLTRNPNRTYLWVYLVLQLIEDDSSTGTDNVTRATSILPASVDEAYEKILSKSKKVDDTRKLLHIVVAATRPLTVTEMAVALSLQETHHSYKYLPRHSEVRSRAYIRGLCGLFVSIVDKKIYLLHQTARDFLVQGIAAETEMKTHCSLKWKESLRPHESHTILRQICIWQLLSAEFDTHGLHDESDIPQYLHDHPFLDYCATNWALHFRESSAADDSVLDQALRLFDTNLLRTETWFRVFWMNTQSGLRYPQSFTPLLFASYFGLEPIVRFLLHTPNINVNMKDSEYGRTPLFWASENGHDKVVRLFVADRKTRLKRIGRLCFRRGAKIDAQDGEDRTPLSSAILGRHHETVNLLLKEGAKVDAKDKIGGTPISYALSTGQEHLAHQLLKGSPADSASNIKSELLLSAVRSGDVALVSLLLDNGADINARDGLNGTLLHVAARAGREAAIQTLLNNGADIEAKDNGGSTPLHSAARASREAAIQTLLNNGADIEARDTFNETLLHFAVRAGKKAAVQTLLDNGADIEARDNGSNTPLYSAVHASREAAIQTLLNNGADIEARDTFNKTPLHFAVRASRKAAIQALLDNGADIEARDNGGSTPLIAARYESNRSLLLRRGAKPR